MTSTEEIITITEGWFDYYYNVFPKRPATKTGYKPNLEPANIFLDQIFGNKGIDLTFFRVNNSYKNFPG